MIKITESNPEIIICVYGTLKRQGSLHDYFLGNKSEYLGEFKTLPEFCLWNNNDHYPIASLGTYSITCDLFKIRQQKVLDDILQLEGCSGSLDNPSDIYQLHEIVTPYGIGYMFLQPNYKGAEEDILKQGDWLKKPLKRRDYLHKSFSNEI